MIALGIGFALGCWWLQQQAGLPSPWPLFAAGAVALFAGLGVVARETTVVAIRRQLTAGLLLIAGAALGAGWAAWRADLRLADALDAAREGDDIVVEATVVSLPQASDRGVRFGVVLATPPAGVPQRVQLSWYAPARRAIAGVAADAMADTETEAPAFYPVHVGERWRMTVRLRRVHGNANPHGFDYEGWMLQSGWRATGYVRPGAVERLPDATATPRLVIEQMREAVRARFQTALGASKWGAVLTALAIGDQSGIASAQWALFAQTGITHLISISGLHVTMLAALAHLLTGVVWRRAVTTHWRAAHVLQRVPLPLVAATAGWLTAMAYAAMAGFAVPAQRTVFMLTAVLIAWWTRRDIGAARILCFALLVVLLIDPWAVLAAGFWLSFGAVAVLMLASEPYAAEPAHLRWRNWVRAQWAVTLGSVPLLLALFQQFSLVSPLANAVAIPLVSFVVTPLALAAAIPGLETLLAPAHAVFAGLAAVLEPMANWPWARWQQAAPPGWQVVVALLGGAVLLLPRGVGLRWLGLCGFLPLLTFQPPRPPEGVAWIRVLDVGQGLAVHAQTATHDLVFDTGPAFSSDTDSGNRIIAPYLRAFGVTALDALVVSHSDRDHAGGALSLGREIDVLRLLHSLPESDTVLTSWPDVGRVVSESARCHAGQAWVWNGVHFAFVHPPPGGDAGMPAKNDNAQSCVLRIEAHGRAVLVTSDIEALQEQWLLTHGQPLAADILLVPHHGSKTSSSEAFIDAVGAREAIVPVGYRNRFGHPKAEVIARYEARGIHIHRTDRDGAVGFALDASEPSINSERMSHARYWHGR